VTVELVPLQGLPEIAAGDDLAGLLAGPLGSLDVRDDDVLVVTQKVVSKAEGRLVAQDGTDWVASQTRRVVAKRDDLVIAETRHGFVCANAGVDVSNVPEGFVSLLPDDPDGSAERLRTELSRRLGASPAVVITDTFGRAWRQGVVNVAIGCAGLPALVDLRGTRDHFGHELTATVVALADEVAAASGLVIGKDTRIPAAVVRGIEPGAGSARGARVAPGRASDLLRTPQEDLFRTSPLEAISSRRTATAFGAGKVARAVVEEAVLAACTAPAPGDSRPWLFVALETGPAKRLLLAAVHDARADDLHAAGVDAAEAERRLGTSTRLLGSAPLLIAVCTGLRDANPHPDAEKAGAERDSLVLATGAAVQNLQLALGARAYASRWEACAAFCREQTGRVLGLDPPWEPMGLLAAGPEVVAHDLGSGSPPPASPEPNEYLRFL
jgi:dehydro coenzyme F420 reductase / coenzyme F420-0:L-glutamate ligase / coenzyme F420-1:gamma-L-glutamate ligase